MKQQSLDNNFLAKWLNDDLTAQEKADFEQSEDYPKYSKIITHVDTFKAPVYHKEELLKNINKEITDIPHTPKTISLFPKWSYGIAATFLALIGLFFFFNQSTTYSTNFGEQITYSLPDGSEAVLNSKSSITFNENNWDTNRRIELKGEAFFKVKKGASFTVASETGEVLVIGTEFTVNTEPNFFEVICHEGTVKATATLQNSVILTQGKAYRVVNNTAEQWNIKNMQPSWMFGETSFTNTPLKQVITSFQNQFNVVIDQKNIDQTMRFTGSYNHNDINLALKTIFVPMEISFTFKNQNHIVLVKE